MLIMLTCGFCKIDSIYLMKNWIINVFRRDFRIFVGGLKVFMYSTTQKIPVKMYKNQELFLLVEICLQVTVS